MLNEKTSARVAKIAGKIMALVPVEKNALKIYDAKSGRRVQISFEDIRTIAASCLTQTPDKPAKKTKKRKKKPAKKG